MTLRETIEAIRKSFPEGSEPTTEASTLYKVVNRILRALEWDPDSPAVDFEYGVSDGHGSRGRMDVALLNARRRPVAFIEVKETGKKLTDHVPQTLNYAFMSGVDLCALTNGFEWWMYLPLEAGSPAERRFAVVKIRTDSLDSLADDFQTYLGKGAVLDRSAHRSARQALDSLRHQQDLAERLPDIWKQMLSEPDARLVELVQERVAKELRLRPTGNQISAFLARPDEPVPTPRQASRQLSDSASGARPRQQRKSPSKFTRPTAYRLWGAHHTVRWYKQVFTGLVDALYARHGEIFVRRIQEMKKKQPRFSRDTRGMLAPHSIGESGWHVETSLSADSIKRNNSYLLDYFGHRESDLEVIFPDSSSPDSGTDSD